MRRFWIKHKPVFLKKFEDQPFILNFVLRHVEEFTELIDEWINANGRLKDNFNLKEYFAEIDEEEVVTFDKYYENLSSWMVGQKLITVTELEKVAEQRKKEFEI